MTQRVYTTCFVFRMTCSHALFYKLWCFVFTEIYVGGEGLAAKCLVYWTPGHLNHLYLYLPILQFFPSLKVFTICFYIRGWCLIAHLTGLRWVTRPLNRTEAGVDLVMIPTVLFLFCFHHKVNPLSLFHAEARPHFAELLCGIYT